MRTLKFGLSTFLFILLFASALYAQPYAIINEWSQGNGGNKEWVELLVVNSTVDMRGWKLNDETGTYTTFKATNDIWSAVPAGTIIVIYNGNDVDVTLPAKDVSMVDGNYLICSNHNDTDLFTVGTWGGFGNSTLADCPKLLMSDNTVVHDWDNGNNVLFSVATLRPAGNQAVKYTSNSAAGVSTSTNWTRTAASAGNVTPGAGNGGDNTTWVSTLRGQVDPPAITSVTRTLQNPLPLLPIAIDAEVTGTSNATVSIRYKLNETGEYLTAAMTNVLGTTWSGSIPAQSEGTLVSYYVEAMNQGSSTVRSPSSDSRFRVYSSILGSGELVINEIMYNINTSNQSEWIEFYNNLSTAVDLSYFMLMDNNARSYTLPFGTIIGAGEYRVAPYNTVRFTNDYPSFNTANLLPAFNYEFSLPTDQVRLFDVNGNLIDDVEYTSSDPWPTPLAGYSIELIRPSALNSLGANWVRTADTLGTPGELNSGTRYVAGRGNQVSNPDLTQRGEFIPDIPNDPNTRGMPPFRVLFPTRTEPGALNPNEVTSRYYSRDEAGTLRGLTIDESRFPANNTITRFFEITQTGGVNFNGVDLYLRFTSSDLPAGITDPLTADPPLLASYSTDDGVTWHNVAGVISSLGGGVFEMHISGLDHFSIWALGNAGVLPVSLSAFTANQNGNSVVLNWTTESETSNDYFEIERKTIGSGYEAITRVQSVNESGNSATPQRYSFVDRRISTGDYTYRLTSVDLNGVRENLREAVVHVSPIVVPKSYDLLEAYPNPFNATSTIRVQIREAGIAAIGIYNLNGQLVKELHNGYLNAEAHAYSFDANGLASGVYVVKVSGEFASMQKKLVLLR